VAVVGNIIEGTINDYEAKVEVLIKVHSKIIAKRSATFARNQIAS